MSGTVLVVDDQPHIAEGHAARLRDEYDVYTAIGGREGIAVAEEVDPDVVLLDRRMPDLDGDEVLERLRELEAPPRVAMLTGIEPDVDVVTMPFDDYLVKPVSERALKETVASLFERSTYDARLQEFFSLASRIAVLETETDPVELRMDPHYWRLQDRKRRMRRSLDERLDGLGHDGLHIAIGDTFR
jgi:two-component system response regulator AdeR